MDSPMDDLLNARRRWLAVVFRRFLGPVIRRAGTIRSARRNGECRWFRRSDLSGPETERREEAPVRIAAALLGDAASTGPIFFPFRAFDYRVRGGAITRPFLSFDHG